MEKADENVFPIKVASKNKRNNSEVIKYINKQIELVSKKTAVL